MISDQLVFMFGSYYIRYVKTVVPDLGPPDVLGLQLPEILVSRGDGEGFWELESKNIWRPKVGDH